MNLFLKKNKDWFTKFKPLKIKKNKKKYIL